MAVARRPRRPARRNRWIGRVLAEAISLGGLAGVVLAVYLVVVLGVGRIPTSRQWTLIGFSMLAAAVVALVYQPVRARLAAFAARLVRAEPANPGDLLQAFGTRLSRPMPLEELLLQLAESLRTTLALDVAEVWTGSGGLLERTASDPHAGQGNLILTAAEEPVVARAGVSGPAWVKVWLPQLLAGREQAPVRVTPITYSGELLGLIVVARSTEGVPFTGEDEQVLGALARQVGLALNNVRLGSALNASLDEVQKQAEELRVSRARVVAAADDERRRIERDLHDGAQQHLIALAVNLRLARELAQSDPVEARAVLDQLADDVQDALDGVRDLAHGIYPPVLVDHGLSQGLRAAITRAPVRARLEIGALGRYPPEVEATVYFCCLEALQNAGKHAGNGTRATVRVWEDGGGLLFEIEDDGKGFDARGQARGAGLSNMSDRLGALGGRLSIHSSRGQGTRVAGTVPLLT